MISNEMISEAVKKYNALRYRDMMEPCLKPFLPYVLEALKEIKNGNVFNEHCGICSNLHYICREWYWKDWDIAEWSYELGTNILDYYFEQWEHFSGNIEYPIEGEADEYGMQGNMWDQTTKWGKLRWDLLDYLIERIEDDISTENQEGAYNDSTTETKLA